MEPINIGFLSILPPIIAICLALKTKEVISSLIAGILCGTFIYALNTSSGILEITAKTFDVTANLMATKISSNASILLFLGFLGALVVVVTHAGGSKAYGEWAAKKIKSRRSAHIATSALSLLIFIDDYFNCLTVGTVMRPVTDKYKISHAKLAYLIDSTAAPICIIAPVSSWAASVISQIENAGLNGMSAFVSTIPYNLYAILTIIMVFSLAIFKLDFGPMEEHEYNAIKYGNLDFTSSKGVSTPKDELSDLEISPNGTIWDLLIPIIGLIVFSVLAMLYIGGYFNGGMTIAEGFGNTDAGYALSIAGFGALLLAFLIFIPRKILTFNQFTESITKGVKSMAGPFIILILAWTMSGVCRDLLSTGEYVGELVATSNMPVILIPAIIFTVAGILSFSMGTSWGTFSILIPIVVAVCQNIAPELTTISLSATLAGSVFGDHCSPISDTTILSSTSASCNHIDHVSTQIPYALIVAASCIVGYITAGITANLFLTLTLSTITLILSLVILHRISIAKENNSK